MCRKAGQRGRGPAWLHRELRLELRHKKRMYNVWKEGQATQEEHKNPVRLCMQKIRRAKDRLELCLPTAVKGNKQCFSKDISKKRRAKENLHPLMNVGGNMVPEDEEKAELPNAFFASVFHSQNSCVPGTQPPEPEGRRGEQNEAPLGHPLVYGTRWDTAKSAEGAGGRDHLAISRYLSALLANWGGPS